MNTKKERSLRALAKKIREADASDRIDMLIEACTRGSQALKDLKMKEKEEVKNEGEL